jgi:chromosome segregation ATPase
MEQSQVDQMLKWLDEERRKDKALIAALQERVELQAQQLARQEEQLTTLQETTARLEALLSRVTGFTETVEQVKTDVVQMLDQRDERWRKEQRESERSHQLEISALRDEMARLQEQVRAIQRLEEGLTGMQAESRRLNEALQKLEIAIADLSKRSEERVQTVVYLEEQRRADNRRIASLEADSTDLRKRIEGMSSKVAVLEEMVQKQRSRIEEGLKPIKEFEKVVEELRVADFRRNQAVKKWEGQVEAIRAEFERLQAERQQFIQEHQDVKRALERLETFQSRLETRQNEVAEMQRMAEERLKRQWEEWQAGREKEHRHWELAQEERWKQQERTNETLNRGVENALRTLQLHHAQLIALWEEQRADASRLLEMAQKEYEARVSGIEEHLSTLREHTIQEK